jgi:Transposase DDE domain
LIRWHIALVLHDVPPIPVSITPQDRDSALWVLSRGGWLQKHLDRLAALPAHGNRRLCVKQLFVGLLLSFFDPMARSLRTIEDKDDFDGQLDLPRLARSTTSDALAVFDPACLKPVIDELLERVPNLAQCDTDLSQITRRIIAADGTYLNTLADVAWALKQTRRNGRKMGQVRANVQMDTLNWTPRVISISGDDGTSEPAAFAKDLLEGVLYVMDRNFLDFEFLRQLLGKNNDFVLRVRDNAPAVTILQTLELEQADLEAGVVSDEIVELTGRDAPTGWFRRVTIHTVDREGKPQTIRLLSNLTDPAIPARVVGAIYRQRWQIELFFKWLKTFARMDHLLSTSRLGITFQFYVAVIGVLMMYVQSGRRVSIYTLAAMSRLARGECTLDQAMAVIARREHERDLNRARQARKRALKKPA